MIILFLSSCQSNFSLSYTGDYCEDGLKDRDEENVDCGGQYCDACDGSESGTTLSADCGDTTYTITAGDTISFDGSGSSGSGTLAYSWDFDDDGIGDTSSITSDYGYDDTGTYTVTLTVTDEDGDKETCTATVIVKEIVQVDDIGAVVSSVTCIDNDEDGDNSDESEIYFGSTATVTTKYTSGDSDVETYTDSCSGTDLTEYACSEDGVVLATIPVICGFGCADDGVACVEDGTDYDFDDDGLTDAEETTYGTYPTITDSDYDGLTDYEEVMTYFTDPVDRDSDDDGMRDDREIMRGTDPWEADTDVDGLGDYVEAQGSTGYFTSPLDD
ncbi:MAG: PKD domain-containing protein, partial [Nanoarchaeota archaeon]